MKHTHTLAAAAALALLAACGKDAAPGGETTASDMQAMVDGAADEARRQGATAGGDAPLKPGQSVQGTIQADVGKGTQSFRSLATKVADDAAGQFDAAMQDGSGGKALEQANQRLERLGTGMKVDAGDVRDIVANAAGKTFHEASVLDIGRLGLLQATMDAKAADGSTLKLTLDFDAGSLAYKDAVLAYNPGSKSMFDYYEGKDVQVTVERFERNDDGSYALAGTFDARDIPAARLAKELKGRTLASASGRFDYASLPEKQMPKIGL